MIVRLTVSLVLLATGIAIVAHAQDQTKPVPLSVDDLQQATISGYVIYAGQGRGSVNKITKPWTQKWSFKIRVGPGTQVKWTVDTANKFGEQRISRHFSYSTTLAKPDTRSEQHGVGARAVVWTLDNNVLSMLRVFEAGGRVVKIALARDGDKLNCTAEGAFMNETGRGNPKTKDPDHGGYFEYIGVKQVSSACTAQKN